MVKRPFGMHKRQEEEEIIPARDLSDDGSCYISDEVRKLSSEITIPSDRWFMPKKDNLPINISHQQAIMLGHEISEMTGDEWRLISAGISYMLANEDSSFKQLIGNYSAFQSEVLDIQSKSILPNPRIKDLGNGMITYIGKGEPIEVDIGSPRSMLVEAGQLIGTEKVGSGYLDRKMLTIKDRFAPFFSYMTHDKTSGYSEFHMDLLPFKVTHAVPVYWNDSEHRRRMSRSSYRK